MFHRVHVTALCAFAQGAPFSHSGFYPYPLESLDDGEGVVECPWLYTVEVGHGRCTRWRFGSCRTTSSIRDALEASSASRAESYEQLLRVADFVPALALSSVTGVHGSKRQGQRWCRVHFGGLGIMRPNGPI